MRANSWCVIGGAGVSTTGGRAGGRDFGGGTTPPGGAGGGGTGRGAGGGGTGGDWARAPSPGATRADRASRPTAKVRTIQLLLFSGGGAPRLGGEFEAASSIVG